MWCVGHVSKGPSLLLLRGERHILIYILVNWVVDMIYPPDGTGQNLRVLYFSL